MLRGAIALQFGKAALVPELYGQTDDGAALFLEQRWNGGGIHTAGHGDSDEAALDFCVLRKGIELGGRGHAHKKGTRRGRWHYTFILAGFRHFWIGGRQLAELPHGGRNDLQRKVNFLFCGEAAEAEAQAGAGFFRRQANGGKNM